MNISGKFNDNIRQTRDTSRADAIFAGVLHLLYESGWTALTEVSLANHRRADILAVSKKGEFLIIEVKSCLADFASDTKWPDYLDWCDQFAFAVDRDFPLQELPPPDQAGLIIADAFGGAFIQDPVGDKLAAARRKALTLKFARLAASRLYRVTTNPVS